MPKRTDGIPAPLTAGIRERLRDVAGNAAILGGVVLLGLTAWVACIAGLVAVLAPPWGMAAAIFSVALLNLVVALVLLVVLQRRSRLQQARAARRQAETRSKGQAALLAALPALLRQRSGAVVVVSGLVLGAMIVGALQAEDDP
ncbi:hypothetical protein [Maliponia aquimaris]|uniref:Uncharacterized protein n=1 Tax=Maliponia aquimaris TaxID=1673631 RepID=A0A238L153_9RHOB|nr:hypothetical protein [Maliponia aquimaris]SMX48815.1 hypothetical protein MAA8898_04118 [Maliponia aquimaris]